MFEAQRLLEQRIRDGEPMTFDLELPDPRVEVSLLVGPHADDEICSDPGSGIERLHAQDAVGGSLVVALSFDSETGEPLGDLVASSVVFEPASDGDDPLTLPPVTIIGVRVNSAQG